MDDATVPFLDAEDGETNPNAKHHHREQNGGRVIPNSSMEQQPIDHYNLVYCIIFLHGVGMLLPWNFFITASNYFEYKLRANKEFKNNFENVFSIAAMIPAVFTLLLNVYVAHRINRHLRVGTCLFITLIMFIFTTVLVRIDTATWTNKFFAVTVASVVVINTACAIYQGGIFGIAGLLGQRYTQAIMGGQGLGGTFAAVASVISIACSSKPSDSAFGYFLCACAVIFVCIIAYWGMFQLEFVKESLKRAAAPPQMDFNSYDSSRRSQLSDDLMGVSSSSLNEQDSLDSTSNTEKISPPFFLIFKRIFPMIFSVTLVFFVTLALFPSVTVKIKSMNKANNSIWTNGLFSPIVCFLLFNLSDFCGRTCAGWIQAFSVKGVWIPVLSFARVVFFPLFLMCNYERNNGYLPLVFNHDAYPIVFMVLFGLSNGYIGSLGMMFGPKLVQQFHAETAANMMALALSLGLALGAGFSFVLLALM